MFITNFKDLKSSKYYWVRGKGEESWEVARYWVGKLTFTDGSKDDIAKYDIIAQPIEEPKVP